MRYALTCLFVLVARLAAGQQMIWYDNAIGNPGDRQAQMREVAPHASGTMSPRYWHEGDWAEAKRLGLKVVLGIPSEIYWAVDEAHPLDVEMPMWCRMPSNWPLFEHPTDEDPYGWCNKKVKDWIALVEQHREQILAIGIVDETDCNTKDGRIRFPNWTRASCEEAGRLIAALHYAIKSRLPWIRTWANYTAAWAFYFRLAAISGRSPSYYGVALPHTDIISMDAYTPFAFAFGSNSVKTLYDAWKLHLLPGQKFALIPRAFMGSYLNWNPTASELGVMAWQYYAFMREEPLVELMVPFLYRSIGEEGLTGAMYTPSVRFEWERIGLLITGKAPAAPTGLRFIYE